MVFWIVVNAECRPLWQGVAFDRIINVNWQVHSVHLLKSNSVHRESSTSCHGFIPFSFFCAFTIAQSKNLPAKFYILRNHIHFVFVCTLRQETVDMRAGGDLACFSISDSDGTLPDINLILSPLFSLSSLRLLDIRNSGNETQLFFIMTKKPAETCAQLQHISPVASWLLSRSE